MSNRLESLNSKKPGAKPALKFKPKAVARKSKEAREKDAPAVKTEEPSRMPPTRGRGGARGRGRGRGGAYVGTHLVSAGPLAMGSVSVGPGTTNSKTGLTSDRIYGVDNTLNDPLAHLKSRKSKSATPDAASDDEDDPRKINMSKEYAFEESEVVLFPVRPQKDEPEDKAAVGALSTTTLVSNTKSPTVESVKSELLEEVAQPQVIGPDDALETAEYNRHIDDRLDIVDLLTTQLSGLKTDEDGAGPGEKYFTVHLPQVISESSEEIELKSTFANSNNQNIEGHVGNINFHKSGKISISIGNTLFDVSAGVPSSFLQEVVVLDSHAARKSDDDESEMLDADGMKIGGNIFRLGEVAGKIVATPTV